jgi:hypothetical protein
MIIRVLLIPVLMEVRHFLFFEAFSSARALKKWVPGLFARGGGGEFMRYVGCDKTTKNKLN